RPATRRRTSRRSSTPPTDWWSRPTCGGRRPVLRRTPTRPTPRRCTATGRGFGPCRTSRGSCRATARGSFPTTRRPTKRGRLHAVAPGRPGLPAVGLPDHVRVDGVLPCVVRIEPPPELVVAVPPERHQLEDAGRAGRRVARGRLVPALAPPH